MKLSRGMRPQSCHSEQVPSGSSGEIFPTYLNCANESEVFQYLTSDLTNSITLWDYFVNWRKVLYNYKQIETHLNLLNYLIGKTDIEAELRYLLTQYPDVICVIPALVASRKSKFEILTSYTLEDLDCKSFSFKQKERLSDREIDDVIEFVTETGLLELFTNRSIKSIPDYVIGIEVGLDSNARKNRSGTTMEKIVEAKLNLICQRNNLSSIKQATSSSIQQNWGIRVDVDKADRKFDFALRSTNGYLYIIETNFYGGGGSKLKSTAGEYKDLHDFISRQSHRFIWITDGLGWKTALRPLEETFNSVDYILNLKMVSTGLLAQIIDREL